MILRQLLLAAMMILLYCGMFTGCAQLKDRWPLRKNAATKPATEQSTAWNTQTTAEGTVLPPNTALPVRKRLGNPE